jgi:hypothetical protein
MYQLRSDRVLLARAAIEQEWSEYYFKFMTKHNKNLFDNSLISKNINISLQTILNHPEYEWNVDGIAQNPNMTWEFLKSYKAALNHDFAWNFRCHSMHYTNDYENNEDLREIGKPPRPNIAFRDDYSIDDVLDKKGSCAYMMSSINLFPQDLIDHPEINWNYRLFAVKNPNMTAAYFKKFIELGLIHNWKGSLASYNIAYDIEDMVNTPELEWDYDGLSINPKLRFQFILDNPTIHGKEYLVHVDENDFIVEKAAFIDRRIREYLVVYKIKQWWLFVTNHPENIVCKRRLNSQFDQFKHEHAQFISKHGVKIETTSVVVDDVIEPPK